VAGPNNVHTNLHQRGAQILFLDGHAQRRRSADYWDFSTGRGRWSVLGLVWAPDDTGLPLTNGVPSLMPDLRWDENPALTIREAAAASRS
jgi:prepilin-type processing-associated H-X9-DG protein